jgi:DNA-binding MarR family transcriptional regulator
MPANLAFDPIAEARRHWERRWGEEPAPAMAAVTSIMRAHQILLARLNGLLAPWGLTFARYEALMLLHVSRRGALPLGKMGDRLQVHRASVTNVVDRLAAQGLVDRVQHEHDRRAVLAVITAEGRRVAEEATERLNAEGFGLAPPLSAEQCEQLVDVLGDLRVDAGDFG